MTKTLTTLLGLLAVTAVAAEAQTKTAHATLKNTKGETAGMAHLTQTEQGVPDAEESVVAERMAAGVTLERGVDGSLFDADGSAIVIHAGPDDYASQPSGSAGARIMCGVIEG